MEDILCPTPVEIYSFSCSDLGSHGYFKPVCSLELCWFNGFLHLLFHTHFSSTTVPVGVQTNLLQCCPICMIITPPVALFHQTKTTWWPTKCRIHIFSFQSFVTVPVTSGYDTILYHISHWPAVVVIGCVCGRSDDSDQSLLVFALNRWYINYASAAGDIALLFGICFQSDPTVTNK